MQWTLNNELDYRLLNSQIFRKIGENNFTFLEHKKDHCNLELWGGYMLSIFESVPARTLSVQLFLGEKEIGEWDLEPVWSWDEEGHPLWDTLKSLDIIEE